MSLRARRALVIPVVVAALGLIAASCSSNEQTSTTPASTTTAPPATPPGSSGPVSIRNADLSGMPVPAAWCTGLEGLVDGTVTLVDGKAGAEDPGPGNAAGAAFKLEDDPVLYSDVDGDGVEDAVARLTCFRWNSDDAATHVAVFSIRDGRPTVALTIDEAGVQHMSEDEVTPVQYTKATAIRLDGELLAVDWASDRSPATTTTVRYLIMGGTPTVANDTGPVFPT